MTNPVHVDAPAGVPFIDITREFDAPVSRVFAAHADPALVAKWMGPDRLETDITEWDFVSGGRWSFQQTEPGGESYGFRGTFHTVRTDELAIQTFEFLGYPDVVAVETLRFVDLDDDRTRLEIHSVYPSLEARDGMVASGMEGGLTQGYARLDTIVAG
ncbi:polyketide cyclase [Cellulomonas sp. A375-1]|uniref:Activator of HSP90 ATPase n=1 Tax=Cellulomonas gelida TaxID=1712 RepID=A0A4Y3KNN8_9CELL|nr:MULTISPECIES: SRPBCC family protein [Cellulomonas]KMM45174.1 polyketide cyclase [Cellulomonas sp. A375-1]MCR6704112.1 SRPBCC family protein [Cellulomonas sp.]GEA85577.1 activator of HSP90 ATPase [Cellulomonas gelida]GGL23111.1 activator of HSP90 ATPase [Cellulomonas gelida]